MGARPVASVRHPALPTRGAGDRGFQFRAPVRGYQHAHSDVGPEGLVLDLGFKGSESVLHPWRHFVRNIHQHDNPCGSIHSRAYLCRIPHSTRIGAYQTTGSQLDAAVVAGAHRHHLPQPRMEERVQHGPPCGAARLARVTHAHLGSRARRSRIERPAVVGGARMPLPHLPNEARSVGAAFRPAKNGDEAAPPDHFPAFDRVHGHGVAVALAAATVHAGSVTHAAGRAGGWVPPARGTLAGLSICGLRPYSCTPRC